MTKITCIIIDDEPLSQDVLEGYINDTEQLDLRGICNDASEAGELLRKDNVDLLFLDIRMPGISGLQFLRSLNNPPLVVFTTAYPEFAVEGFEVDAVDYLLKPFPYERFLKSVNKVFDKLNSITAVKSEQNFLWLKSDKKLNRVNVNEICFVEAIGDYVKIVCENSNLVIHETMQGILKKLSASEFARIHRSYIVSIGKISYVEGNHLLIKDARLPIGKSYRDNFFGHLNN